MFVDVACRVEHAAGHEGVGHTLLVDRSAPGLTELWLFTLVHLGQNQVAKVLGGGVDHPNAGLICGQVQVCVRVAFTKLAEVTL